MASKLALPAIILILISSAWAQEAPVSLAPVVTTAPTTQPVPDVAKGPVDPYDMPAEKMKFFEAAGADSELDAQEFEANQKKASGFVRSFDRWAAMLAFDKNANKTIDWLEADAYRQDLRKRVLAAFDADKDGKLMGVERDAANRALRAGRLTASATSAPASRPSWRDTLAQYDTDGDGQLNEQERQAMREAFRQRMMERYDTDGDGQLSDEERAAMTRRAGDGMGRSGNPMAGVFEELRLRNFDADGDGVLDEQEQADFEAFRARADEMGRQWQARLMDTDGDGQVSQEERRAFGAGMMMAGIGLMQKFQQAVDIDGDGQVSPEERAEFAERTRENVQSWLVGTLQKYDADGDGRLLGKERENLLAGLNQDFEARARKFSPQTGRLGPQEAIMMFEDFLREIGVLPGEEPVLEQ